MRKSAFTLIEMAIALVVISIGMLTLMKLFSDGFVRARTAIGEVRAAHFAGDVFDTLRAMSAKATYWHADSNAWVDVWDTWAYGETNFPVAMSGLWGDGKSDLLIQGNDTPLLLAFTNIEGVVSHAFRYQLTIVPPPFPETGTNWASATLHIWEGVRGPTTLDTAVSFYSEFPRAGATP